MKVEENFVQKIQKIQDWFPSLIKDIKKEVKTELQRSYPKVYQKYFSRMHFAKCSLSELAAPLLAEVLAGNEELAEWLASQWVTKRSDAYYFFAQRLEKINPQFDQIEELEEGQGKILIAEAVEEYGAATTYIFSILNSVAFSPAQLELLFNLAKEESALARPG